MTLQERILNVIQYIVEPKSPFAKHIKDAQRLKLNKISAYFQTYDSIETFKQADFEEVLNKIQDIADIASIATKFNEKRYEEYGAKARTLKDEVEGTKQKMNDELDARDKSNVKSYLYHKLHTAFLAAEIKYNEAVDELERLISEIKVFYKKERKPIGKSAKQISVIRYDIHQLIENITQVDFIKKDTTNKKSVIFDKEYERTGLDAEKEMAADKLARIAYEIYLIYRNEPSATEEECLNIMNLANDLDNKYHTKGVSARNMVTHGMEQLNEILANNMWLSNRFLEDCTKHMKVVRDVITQHGAIDVAKKRNRSLGTMVKLLRENNRKDDISDEDLVRFDPKNKTR